ncbi:MAG: radical SAM protein [candidate division WOR-3 bacterium]|nr:MAG: radical SAM protein [candidate division WOR-3 bacterium]
MTLYDPLEKAKHVESIVSDNLKRKYYRVARPGRWYGGIATADCCGCNLECVFCWSDKPRENPDRYGRLFNPEQISTEIIQCARKNKYGLVRISGNEPTLVREHLLHILRIISNTELLFILETNGTLFDREFVRELARFENLRVRVSLKGTNPEEFSMLTGAIPETFDRILDNLRLLLEYGVKFNLAVMLSFSPGASITKLKKGVSNISPSILDGLEEEYVILYPHVAQKVKNRGIEPLIAYTPCGVPKKLI